MMGKLSGVCLAGLTQVAIWVFSALAIASYSLVLMNSTGSFREITNITPIFVVYFLVLLFDWIFSLFDNLRTDRVDGYDHARGWSVRLNHRFYLNGLYSVIPIVRDPNSTFSLSDPLFPLFRRYRCPYESLPKCRHYGRFCFHYFSTF